MAAGWARRLLHLDRRLLYLAAALAMAAAAISPPRLPIRVGADTRRAWDLAAALPRGAHVFIWIDYGFGAQEELDPMLAAVAEQLMRQGAVLVMAARQPEGSQIALDVVSRVARDFPAYRDGYGRTWVDLGFRPVPEVTLRAATADLKAAYNGVDMAGRPLAGMPALAGVRALDARDFALAYVFDMGDGFAQMMYFVGQPTGLPFVVGAISMEVPVIQPYLAAGQVAAVIGGARGAAEYEELLGRPGRATAQQEASAVAAATVALLVVLGNAAEWLLRRG